MYQNKKILGIIPARGGSKGIPQKNLALLGGRPLLSWVGEQALNCPEIDELVLSTDNTAIREAGQKLNLKAPFLRPAALAKDESSSYEFIEHAVNWFSQERGLTFDYVCLMQPTAPFTLQSDYSRAIQKAVDQEADTVISIIPCGQKHPALMYQINKRGKAEWFLKSKGEQRMIRRQDLPPLYQRTGNVYVFKVTTLLKSKSLYGGSIYTQEVPENRAWDIDTIFDLQVANAMVTVQGDHS